MSSFLRRIFLLLLALGIGPGFLASLYSQTPPALPPGLVAVKGVQTPPLPPVPKSPVDILRELLTMKPGEQERFLSNRPPEIRKRFLAKIQEYEAMKPEERELRLRATQLRWYLLPLMQTPATNRLAQLALIPEADRKLVSERLQQWDLLPPGLQKEFLEYGLTASYFVGKDTDHTDSTPKVPLQILPPPDLVSKINYVSQLPPEKRQQMYDNFQHFFELTDADKQKTLNALSPVERQQMLRTLQNFQRLPRSQREECLQSFGKFANMTAEERQGFFKNAERWKELSPAERQAWRNLVNRFPPLPPMPPGFGAPPMPPMPASYRKVSPQPDVPVATSESP